MKPRLVDDETLQAQVLVAAQACLAEGLRPTVRNLRARGVHGHERRLYKVRKRLADLGKIPLESISAHSTHSNTGKCKPRIARPLARWSETLHAFTQNMVHLYGGRQRLRREYGINQGTHRTACPPDSQEDSPQ